MYQIRDRHSNWHDLTLTVFYIGGRGNVLTYHIPGNDFVCIDADKIGHYIELGDVRIDPDYDRYDREPPECTDDSIPRWCLKSFDIDPGTEWV